MTVESFSPTELNITMTDAAAVHARKQLSAANALGIGLGVKNAGCSGFKYEISLAKEITTKDIVIEVAQGVNVIVQPENIPYVNGTEIDFTQEGVNTSLVFNNPNAKDACGCGESFNV
jgi:Fe-S cluster assembly protein SufA/iron-sulfur cluster assembly protein